MKTQNISLTDKELDEELDKEYEEHKESILAVAENQAIDEIIDDLISEDTVEHYKEAPTEQEFAETFNKMTPEDAPSAYVVQTQEEIADSISERVKKRLEEAKNKQQPKELKAFIDSKAEREEMLKNTNSTNWRSNYNTQKEREGNSSKRGFFWKLFYSK